MMRAMASEQPYLQLDRSSRTDLSRFPLRDPIHDPILDVRHARGLSTRAWYLPIGRSTREEAARFFDESPIDSMAANEDEIVLSDDKDLGARRARFHGR
jgi:hypothetical protein